MYRLTISVPDELKVKMDAKPEVNWVEIIRRGIMAKLEKLEKLRERGEL
jgi:hypothetical protein